MSAPIEDVSSLPGKEVIDQYEETIGKIKEIYAIDGDGHPTWVTVEGSFEDGKRTVFIPLARLKEEEGALYVPYSSDHIGRTPEVEGDEISEECERQLRDHYGIDRGDQELRTDNNSYATLVPDEEGTSKRVENVDELETPSADKRTDETRARLEDPGSSEIRKVTAEDVIKENKERKEADAKDGGEDEDEDDDDGEGDDGGEGDGGGEDNDDADARGQDDARADDRQDDEAGESEPAS